MTLSGCDSQQRLSATIEEIVRTGTGSGLTLRVDPARYDALTQAVSGWSVDVVEASDDAMQACGKCALDSRELVGQFMRWFFRSLPDGRQPLVQILLHKARSAGVGEAIAFLQGYLLEYALQTEGRLRNLDACRYSLQEFFGRDGRQLDEALSTLGATPETFIADVFFLGELLGAKTRSMTELFGAGHHLSFVADMVELLSQSLERDMSEVLAPMIRQAAGFALPAHCRENWSALVAYVMGQRHQATIRRVRQESGA